MQILNTCNIACKAIWTNKVRSFLTMLGIIIGISSVVMLMSIGKGIEVYISEQFETLGSNNLFVIPGNYEDGNMMDREQQMIAYANNKLRISHVNELERLRAHVKAVIPFYSHPDVASFQGEDFNVSVVGVSQEAQNVMSIEFDKGRFFDNNEEKSGKKVIVLGYEVAEELFGQADPIGKKIKLAGQTFKVIGVVEEQGGGPSSIIRDDYVYTSIRTTSKLYDTNEVMELIVQIKDTSNIEEKIAIVEKKLEETLDEDDFSVIEPSSILNMINEILGILTTGLGSIAAISLLVGGIGIMNIMLVSVTERTREIGLRKALGATPNQIMIQFLIEAAVLSLFGGVIALIIVYFGSLALQNFFPAKVTLNSIFLSFGVSTVIGLIFGAAPAKRAAKLSPIEALRYE